jgi:hypothetical protein
MVERKLVEPVAARRLRSLSLGAKNSRQRVEKWMLKNSRFSTRTTRIMQ